MATAPIIQHSDKVFAYFCNAAGKIIPAPDTRMTPKQCGLGPEWRRCEAVGAKEIEKVSLIISRQLWEEKKQLKVQQKLREMEFLKEREVSAKLRGAKNFSPHDVEVNRDRERIWNRKQDQLLALIYEEFDPTKRHTALAMELGDASIARGPKKHEGIA